MRRGLPAARAATPAARLLLGEWRTLRGACLLLRRRAHPHPWRHRRACLGIIHCRTQFEGLASWSARASGAVVAFCDKAGPMSCGIPPLFGVVPVPGFATEYSGICRCGARRGDWAAITLHETIFLRPT